MSNPTAELMSPSLSLLVKLGSAIVHADEARSTKGHPYDWTAFDQLLADKEVQKWLSAMMQASFLPVKR